MGFRSQFGLLVGINLDLLKLSFLEGFCEASLVFGIDLRFLEPTCDGSSKLVTFLSTVSNFSEPVQSFSEAVFIFCSHLGLVGGICQKD